MEDELSQNRKAGYLDKMAFLQRADLKAFERERDIRLAAQAKRPS